MQNIFQGFNSFPKGLLESIDMQIIFLWSGFYVSVSFSWFSIRLPP